MKRERTLRDTCRELDGRYDQAALDLILRVGVLATNDTDDFIDAVDRLSGVPSDYLDAIVEAQERVERADRREDRIPAVRALEDLYGDHDYRMTHAAYLLGIAVGRRLGGAPLTGKAGATAKAAIVRLHPDTVG